MLFALREIVISLGNILEEREGWVKGKTMVQMASIMLLAEVLLLLGIKGACRALGIQEPI